MRWEKGRKGEEKGGAYEREVERGRRGRIGGGCDGGGEGRGGEVEWERVGGKGDARV